jgi:hypothetical protein
LCLNKSSTTTKNKHEKPDAPRGGLCRRRPTNRRLQERLLLPVRRLVLQARRQRLHRRVLQRPGHLRELLHQRRRLRGVLQKIIRRKFTTPDGFSRSAFLFGFIAAENLFSFRR